MEQQVIEDAIAVLAVNWSTPAHVVDHLAEPHDRVQSVLHISGEALLLLG